jgi:hypothetical protein
MREAKDVAVELEDVRGERRRQGDVATGEPTHHRGCGIRQRGDRGEHLPGGPR